MIRSRLRAVFTFLPLVASVGGCASAGARGLVTPTVGDRFFVAGYHPYWAEDAWQGYPYEALDQLYFFEIEVGADGRLGDRHGWPEQWTPMLVRAREAGVQVVPTISLHDADAFVELFGAPANSNRLGENLVALLLETADLGGLHLDFEVFQPVELSARDGYTAFVATLRRRMDEVDPALSLSVFTLAFDDDDVYNERALAELADFLVVQGYDFHSEDDDQTGPVAAVEGWGRLNWGNVVDRFLGFGVPARRIVMAVPLYGYEWPAETDLPGARTIGPGATIPLAPPAEVLPGAPRARAQATLHGLRRDQASGSPYYAFHDGVVWYQGWFDDAESLRAKYAFVRERGLGGVALFPLAYGDAPLWADLRSSFSLPRE